MAFKLVPLEQLDIQLIDGDRGKNYPKQHDFTNEGHCLFLSAKNVTKLGFEFEQQAFISEDKDQQLRAGKLQIDDIVLTTRGTIGNVALYHDGIPFNHIRINSGMLILRANAQRWNSGFLYFVLTSELLKQQISALTSGSAVPQLPARDIKKFLVPDIPKYQQDRIVNQLSKLNSKITLNRQINQTLEQMAQTLFKSWFVDFDPVIDNALDAGNVIPDELQARAEQRQALRNAATQQGDASATPAGNAKPLPDDIRQLFPNKFEESELGWVPKGWDCLMLGDICTELRRGLSPKYIEEGGVLVINQKCIRNHDINYDLVRRNDPELRKIDGREILIGDVLINSTGVGTLGRMAQVHYIPEKTVVDSHVTIARVDTSKCPIFTFGQLMLSVEGRVERLGEGSTGQTELSRKVLLEQWMVFPPKNLALEIEDTFKSIVDKKVSNSKQVQVLEKLRDTLLPKLISDELRLDDVESMIEETITA